MTEHLHSGIDLREMKKYVYQKIVQKMFVVTLKY